MQRYEAAFLQLDKDRDGLVQGRDCFGYFMQWNLDKAVLKHIWDVVAGNKGTLNKQQLASCLYLMDNAKKGIKPPMKLPPGPFPPVATSWTPQTQFNQAKLGATPYQPPPLPTMPQLPAKYVEPAVTSPPPEKPPQTPKLDDSTAALLSESERAKITMMQREAADREAKLNSAEAQAAAAKSKVAAYNNALQEITVFKSRTELALLQGQDEASRLEEELTECKRKYEQSYNHAQSQGRAANKLRERLAEIIEQRTEGEKKLMQLQSEIAEASKLTPQDVANMEAHVAVLAGQVLALANEAQAARNNKGGKGGVGKTAELLSKAAAAYRTLYSSVERAGGEVPFDARPANLGLATWLDDALAGAADFADAMGGADAAHGYVLVNALPGQVAPKPTPPPVKDEKGNIVAPPADGKQQPQQQQPQQQQQDQKRGSAPLPADSFSEGFGDDAFVMVNGEQEGGGGGAPPAAAQPAADGKGKEEKKDEGLKAISKGDHSKEGAPIQAHSSEPTGVHMHAGKEEKKDEGSEATGKGDHSKEGAPAPAHSSEPMGDLLGGDDDFGGPQPQDQSAEFQMPPPPSEAYASSKGHRRDASSDSRTSGATPSTARSGSAGLGSALGGSGGSGGYGGGYGGFGWQPDADSVQQQSYPATKAGKKRGGGGLDGLFADGPPFPPPPPPAQAPPPFPAFNLNPPVGGGGSSSDEDDDGSDVRQQQHHHGGGADSSDDGMPDELPEAAPPATQPMLVRAALQHQNEYPMGGEVSSSADISHLPSGPSHSLGEESSPRAGAAPISSPISPGGPPAQMNPTYSESVAGGISPRASAVQNPAFSESSDQESDDGRAKEAHVPAPAADSTAAPPPQPSVGEPEPAPAPSGATEEVSQPEPTVSATGPAAGGTESPTSPTPAGGQGGDKSDGAGAEGGGSPGQHAAGGGAGADPSNDDSLL
ncbi:hypothetical protein DUNSADRAFT_18777 [Dunaliella salina]|uniref:EH domain-containing protein n=1 Tax=Dunaliella salina TaxID=3046 RepID=A0ABQ7FZK3_DUNSA|nr:hypothetical protein DUNSADRAFT_18777 [Dunaliella salina]|eukprot:KAF5827771.1 hypothetical protein DUNSADRAFT_18777 [Dunaliella salina]